MQIPQKKVPARICAIRGIRELIFNALVHRDYRIGNAPVRIYEYSGGRLEISNPGGLFGLANPENFPYVSDYRNPLLAEAMKIFGFVNKFNRGIAKVRVELKKNGNPEPTFDVNRVTEFRVTLLANRTLPIGGTINDTINSGRGTINGSINSHIGSDGTINGTITPEIDSVGTINNETKIKNAIGEHPGIKREGLLIKTGISLRTIARVLKSLKESGVVEYSGSKKTGGWYPRT